MYLSWNSIDVEPLVLYHFGHSKGLLIWHYKCLTEFVKGISQDKDIFLTVSGWIHGGKSTQRRSSGTLAMMEPGLILGPT